MTVLDEVVGSLLEREGREEGPELLGSGGEGFLESSAVGRGRRSSVVGAEGRDRSGVELRKEKKK